MQWPKNCLIQLGRRLICEYLFFLQDDQSNPKSPMFGSEPDHDSIDPNAPTQMMENQDDSETQIDTNAATQLVENDANDEEQVKIRMILLLEDTLSSKLQKPFKVFDEFL